jgi:threonine/homoserine/homoserine lactone efflux protein
MVPLSHVLAFAAVVTVLIAVPGASVLFTISRALTVGRRAALLTVVGNEIGLCAQVIAVAFGMGAVLERVRRGHWPGPDRTGHDLRETP